MSQGMEQDVADARETFVIRFNPSPARPGALTDERSLHEYSNSIPVAAVHASKLAAIALWTSLSGFIEFGDRSSELEISTRIRFFCQRSGPEVSDATGYESANTESEANIIMTKTPMEQQRIKTSGICVFAANILEVGEPDNEQKRDERQGRQYIKERDLLKIDQTADNDGYRD